jgi:hypothetical protein
MTSKPRVLGIVVVILLLVGSARADDASPKVEAAGAILAALTSPDEAARRTAASQLQALGSVAVPSLAEELAARRKATTPELDKAVAATIKAASPKGPATRDEQLLDDLLRLSPTSEAVRTAQTTECILRTLAHVGTPSAVSELAMLSPDYGGAFRPELGSAIKQLGDRAVPGLIRARRGTTAAVARWATGQLEGMNRRVPGDCVQTKDTDVLADVLRAFGAIRDPDALGVVLSFVNADRDSIRQAARDAVGAYGPDAVPRVREAFAAITGRPASQDWGPPEAARALFAADDEIRLQDTNQLVDAGFQSARDGELKSATLAFDKALARQPDLERAPDLAPVYVMYALTIEDTDRESAQSYLRKAVALAPEGPRAAQAESELSFLEGEQLRDRGVVDESLFRRALQLDPTHARARAVLEQLESAATERHARIRRASALGGALALVLASIVLFVGRRRK